jgi:hypothetical protein
MKIISVSTDELEHPDKAIEAMREAIEAKGGLLGQSAGIVMCQVDFINTGFSSFVSEKLNFPILGATTSTVAVDGHATPFRFCLLILTSDNVVMRAGLTKSLNIVKENLSRAELRRHIDRRYQELYRELNEGMGGPADLILSFIPPIPGCSDERLAKVLFADHEEPFFGTFAVDAHHTKRKSMPSVIYGGDAYDDRCALLALKGGISPKFFLSEIKRANIARQNAVITKCDGNILYEVNFQPAEEYFKSLGVYDKNILVSLNTNPVILYDAIQEKYSPRVLYEITRTGGYLFNGIMPEGATISVGRLEGEEITDSAKKLFGEVASLPDLKGALFFSCLSKQLNLCWDELGEIRILEEAMRDRNIPWLFAYSGGEICPVPDKEGRLTNSHLNLSTCALAL